MAYLGNPVTKNFTTTTSVQTLTGDGSVSYALSAAVAVPEDIAVLRNGVRQKPTTDYSVNGAQITFTTALASSDSCFYFSKWYFIRSKHTGCKQYSTKHDDIFQWCL
jgi:hypothetical protein